MSVLNRLLNWFSDLDGSIDAREDDYEQKAADPKFTGFHRLEKALFGDNTTKGMDQYAEQLYTDVVDLQKRISELAFPPSKVVGGAAGLIEEVAASKISGEEDRYSHTDLWDFGLTLKARRKLSICCVHNCKKPTRNCWQKSMPTLKGRYHSGEIPY